MTRFGLIPRTLTVLTVAGLTLLAVAGTVMWDHASDRDRRALDRAGQEAADQLALALTEPVQNGDGDGLHRRLALVAIPALLAVDVVHLPDHRPLLHDQRGAADRPAHQPVAEATVLARGLPLASVRVSLDPEPAAAARRQQLGWTLGVGLALIAMLDLLAAGLLTTLVVRPLARLDRRLDDPGQIPPAHDPLADASAAPEVRRLGQHLTAQLVSRDGTCRRHAGRCSLDHAILSSIGDGVIAVDADHRITAVNPIAERLTGCPAGNALGRPWGEVLVRADADTIPDPLAAALAHGAVASAGHRLPIISQDGQRRTVLARIARLAGSAGAVLVLRDVTEQLELEERLHRAEKLEDLGRMAGGVAHDFNNLLTGIITASEMLERHNQGDATAERFTSLILRSSEQAADLTRQLLRFARDSRPERTTLDLHATLRHAMTVVEKTPGVPASIHLHLAAPRSGILGNNALLSAVFINLGLNARDAMPRGGALNITTREVEILSGDEVLAPFRLRPGAYLAVTVTDTGTGMDEATRSRLFQPFFTTKRPGKGTGLGLATCYATLRDHGGAITVTSAVGCGSTFVVYLPLARSQDSSAAHPIAKLDQDGAPG